MTVSKQCERMPIGTRLVLEVDESPTYTAAGIVRYGGLIVGGRIGKDGEYYVEIQVLNEEEDE